MKVFIKQIHVARLIFKVCIGVVVFESLMCRADKLMVLIGNTHWRL